MQSTNTEVNLMNQPNKNHQQRLTELYNNSYEYLIENKKVFEIAIETMPVDFLVKLHNHILMIIKEQGENEHLNEMLSKLEDLQKVQEEMQRLLKVEESKQIQETVNLIAEKQRLKKMGPVRKFVYTMNKNRK